ncbi:hypothetical protein ACFOFO_23830 [Undibacterium arcticum]|uniref:SEC-C motif-containing protein n=1 Tax=Undibacterium arcticum TaxID=1762892 RepID=A0ABV7F7L0_9BURK
MLANGHGVATDEAGAMEWLLKAVKKGHALASVALGRIKRAAIAGSVDFQEAEDLFRIALVDANVARLELAELYTLHSEAPQHRLDAASLLQQCYEFALEEDDKELAELCKLKSPAAVAELVRALPRMDTTMRKSAVFVTNFFTANGQPHRRRSDQIEAFWVKARAFTDIAQQASAANRTAAPALPFSPERSGPQTPGAKTASPRMRGARLALELAAKPALKQGRNDYCGCGSQKKHKACCGR